MFLVDSSRVGNILFTYDSILLDFAFKQLPDTATRFKLNRPGLGIDSTSAMVDNYFHVFW